MCRPSERQWWPDRHSETDTRRGGDGGTSPPCHRNHTALQGSSSLTPSLHPPTHPPDGTLPRPCTKYLCRHVLLCTPQSSPMAHVDTWTRAPPASSTTASGRGRTHPFCHSLIDQSFSRWQPPEWRQRRPQYLGDGSDGSDTSTPSHPSCPRGHRLQLGGASGHSEA